MSTTFTDEELEEYRAELERMKVDFEVEFLSFLKFSNNENDREIAEEKFDVAKTTLGEAVEIVNKLSESEDLFPEGISTIPEDLRWESDLDYILRQFDSAIEETGLAVENIKFLEKINEAQSLYPYAYAAAAHYINDDMDQSGIDKLEDVFEEMYEKTGRGEEIEQKINEFMFEHEFNYAENMETINAFVREQLINDPNFSEEVFLKRFGIKPETSKTSFGLADNEEIKAELIDKIFKTGEPDIFLREYLANAQKDSLNYLCERYLEFEEYKNEPFDIVYQRLKDAIYENGEISNVVEDIINNIEDTVELYSLAKEFNINAEENLSSIEIDETLDFEKESEELENKVNSSQAQDFVR